MKQVRERAVSNSCVSFNQKPAPFLCQLGKCYFEILPQVGSMNNTIGSIYHLHSINLALDQNSRQACWFKRWDWSPCNTCLSQQPLQSSTAEERLGGSHGVQVRGETPDFHYFFFFFYKKKSLMRGELPQCGSWQWARSAPWRAEHARFIGNVGAFTEDTTSGGDSSWAALNWGILTYLYLHSLSIRE